MNFPIDATLRKKDPQEAADTGLLLWRENFAGLLLFFAIPFWICAFSLRLLPGSLHYLSWLVLWFFKPFFDRLVLHVISVRFFESGADYKRLLQGLGKTLRRGLLGDLLWRRFSPLRASMMPVRTLEYGSKSRKEALKRKTLLKTGGLNYCFYLTFWGLALETALLAGEYLFVYMMAGFLTGEYFSLTSEFLASAEVYFFAAWCFNYMLVETIYVCMGFSLYINSRINTEGWDIEIIFRGFAKKLRDKKAAGILMIVFVVFLFFPVNASTEELIPAQDAPLHILREIIDSPEFEEEKTTWGVRLKNPIELRDTPQIHVNPIFEKIRIIIGYILRSVLVIIIAVLAVFLFYYTGKFIREKNPAALKSKLTALNGLSSANPDELLEKSVNFHKIGNPRLAWGYCTAAAISVLSMRYNLSFPPNATENECADIAISSPDSVRRDDSEAFRSLINHWVNLAYAGHLPPEGSFEEAIAFCRCLRSADE
ncbi:MAG: hypothetical protein FWC19_08685 [Treponema sp.]|nr:hypothetical protein [Treponema sp.]MCL2272857.1 hypothetical protein [Treponema sp.]